MIKSWRCVRSQSVQSFRVFSIRRDTAVSPRSEIAHDFYVIETQDWVNIIPLTDDQRVVMIKQYRHGSREVTLEIPGGLVESGEAPQEAATRELLEETGYHADEMAKIGVSNPNPAIFNNRCYTFLARNATKVGDPRPDQTEDIEVALIPLTDIPEMIRRGEINHAIVISAFYWLSLKEQPRAGIR